ncbi:helix-turn-helix domain-containing protein [Promicromonospora soli]
MPTIIVASTSYQQKVLWDPNDASTVKVMKPLGPSSQPPPSAIVALTTGERIRLRREARGLTRPVVAGLVGRSPDWLKKIESGTRKLNSLPMLVRIADVLGVDDLSELTGDAAPVPVGAFATEVHHVVPGIREAVRQAGFGLALNGGVPALSPEQLQQRVHRLWLTWHTSTRQRTDVGRVLPLLIRQAHACIRAHDGNDRRRAQAATGDLYRLVQRLLAHICEPELHALAVERGRAMSEAADTPLALAHAAWSSSVSLCASGYYDDAAQLADLGTRLLVPLLEKGPRTDPQIAGVIGALQMEAAAAYGLAGREGDAFHYLDAALSTARQLPQGAWHAQSGFEATNVAILSVIIQGSLHRSGEAINQANRIDAGASPSVVRTSRLLLEVAHAHASKRDPEAAVRSLSAAADVSVEAVALIPWARDLADELAESGSPARTEGRALATRLMAVG